MVSERVRGCFVSHQGDLPPLGRHGSSEISSASPALPGRSGSRLSPPAPFLDPLLQNCLDFFCDRSLAPSSANMAQLSCSGWTPLPRSLLERARRISQMSARRATTAGWRGPAQVGIASPPPFRSPPSLIRYIVADRDADASSDRRSQKSGQLSL